MQRIKGTPPATWPADLELLTEVLTVARGYVLRFAPDVATCAELCEQLDEGAAALARLQARIISLSALVQEVGSRWQAEKARAAPGERGPVQLSSPNALQDARDRGGERGIRTPDTLAGTPDFEKSRPGLTTTPQSGSDDSTRAGSFYELAGVDPIAGASAAAARSWSAASGLLRVVRGDVAELPDQACRRCGCSEQNACVVRADGELRACSWSVVDPSICDACLFPSTRVRGPLDPLEQLAGGGVQ